MLKLSKIFKSCKEQLPVEVVEGKKALRYTLGYSIDAARYALGKGIVYLSIYSLLIYVLLALIIQSVLHLFGLKESTVEVINSFFFVAYWWFILVFSGVWSKPEKIIEARPEKGERRYYLIYNEGGFEFVVPVHKKLFRLLNSGAPCLVFRLLFLAFIY